MNPKFDILIVSLFRIMYQSNYDALIELLWEKEKKLNIEEYYSIYENKLFLDKNITKIEKERRWQVMNSSIFIREEIIPKIIKKIENLDSLYLSSKEKINKYKFNWNNIVKKYLQNENKKKYILKEYDNQSNNVAKNDFVKSRLDKIQDWVFDKKLLLSDFYYLEDLQKNQINLILKTEPIYIILNEILNNNASDLKEILFYLADKNKNVKKEGGQVPNIILTDGIFRAKPIKILENDPNVSDGGDNFVLIHNSNLKINVPKSVRVPELNDNFDYTSDVIYHGKYELATLTAILQLGREQLKKGNTITFTFSQICNLFNLPPTTRTYKRIAKAIFYLKINIYSVKLPNDYERIFNIISAIEKPIFNSDREKEWTIEIDNVLREQILQSHYTELFAEDISSFNYELSPILFKLFLIDKGQDPNLLIKEYTLSNISNRLCLTGKPNVRKRKIINSLNEIKNMNNSIIQNFMSENNDQLFQIYFNKNYHMKNETHISPEKI